MEYIIGIDLGTTNSCVGVWKNNKVDIIPVPETGDKITPSVVCFIHNEEIVGILSKNKSEQYYKSIIYDSKRLIGKKYNEIDKKELEVYPFEIEPDKENNIKIVIKVNEETKKFSPEEISSKILKKLKKDAEVYLGKEVEKAIITVPANFTENQRKSTIKAAELAGLNVLKTINEPTAAAVAYSFENKSEKERIICVFDFGGGTLDITILKNQGMKLNIISTLGDPHLGGQDIDNLLVHHFVQQLKNENNFNVSNNNKELMKLKNICENLKKDLSIRQETSIDYYFKNQEINIEMLRSEFDVLCKDLFSRCIKLLNECIKSSGLKKNEIEEVVLVGGSSRIPKIQEMIKEYFNNEINLCKSINPEEAGAYGAAFTAYKLIIMKIIIKTTILMKTIIIMKIIKKTTILMKTIIIMKIIIKTTILMKTIIIKKIIIKTSILMNIIIIMKIIIKTTILMKTIIIMIMMISIFLMLFLFL